MKKYILFLLVIMSLGQLFAQTDGINYQAVIIDPNVQELPGQNATGNILPNTPISLRFSVINEGGGMDYQEIQQTTTDMFGMINVFVGQGSATSGIFTEINWDGTPKDLKVEIDLKGSQNFEALSQEKLTFIPFAYHRNIIATGNLSVSGFSAFDDDVSIDGNTTINKNLSVLGDTSLEGNVEITGGMTLGEDLIVNGTTNLNNGLSVNNETETNLSGNLQVAGNSSLNQNLDVAGVTNLGAEAIIQGNTQANANLTVGGETTLNNNLTVSEQSPTLLTGTLTVDGETTLNNDFVINGTTIMNNGLSVTGDVAIDGQLQVTEETLLQNTLEVNGATSIQNSLEVSGTTSLQNSLEVNGPTTVRDIFKVDNQSTSLLTGNLIVDGPTEIFNTTTITGETTIENNLQVTANTLVNENLTVDNETNLNDRLLVNNGAETMLSGKLTVDGTSFLNENLNVLGVSDFENDVNVNNGATTNLSGILNVDGVSNLNNDLNVIGFSNLLSELNVDGISTFNDDVTINGELNVNDKIEATGLYVSSDEGVEGDYVAVFENTSGSQDADGIAIKLDTGTLSANNHFVSFYGDNDYLAGRIESYDLLGGDLWETFPVPNFETLLNVFDFSNVLVGGSLPSLSFNGGFLPDMVEGDPGTPGDSGCEGSNSEELEICIPGLFELNFKYGDPTDFNFSSGSFPTTNFDGFYNPTAGSEAASQIGAMVAWGEANGNPGFLPTSPWKIALTPVIIAAKQLAKNQGIVYGSKGADYAEWLEKENPEDDFQFGEVVGVKGGKISRNTEDADQVMTISYNPIVLGNMPEAGKEENYEKVGFMGQVPALVAGEVAIGDFIVASGNNDGYAIAITPEDIELKDLKNIIGRAWSESSPSNLSMINVSVGLKTNEWIMIFEKQDAKIKEIQNQLNELSELSNTVKAIQSKMQQLELN